MPRDEIAISILVLLNVFFGMICLICTISARQGIPFCGSPLARNLSNLSNLPNIDLQFECLVWSCSLDLILLSGTRSLGN
jgi:hypothetical protein